MNNIHVHLSLGHIGSRWFILMLKNQSTLELV